jgi:hypothetical protein
LDYLNRQYKNQKSGTGTNFIRAVPKIERSVNGALDELHYNFSVIGVTETRINQKEISDFNPALQNYNFEYVPTHQAAGGVGMYIQGE